MTAHADRLVSIFRRTLTACACAAVLAVPAAAQNVEPLPLLPGEDPEIVDRVAAVVGDSIILMSQVTEELKLAIAGGRPAPEQPEELRSDMLEILDGMITTQLVLQAAARDTTLVVPDESVAAQVEERVAQARQAYGSEVAFEQALARDGLTEDEFRELLRERAWQTQLQQRYVASRLDQGRPVVVTEAEMRELFEQQRGQLEQLPERVTIQQILLRPEPSDSAWAEARAEADSVYQLLQAGAEFEELARTVSDGPSAPEGGDIGWRRRGTLAPEYEVVAFSLPPGQVSRPVRSDFGWHLIRVDRTRPGEVKSRHILIIPETVESDSDRARELGEDIAEQLRAGAPFQELSDQYGDEQIRTEGMESEITLTRDEINTAMPPGYTLALVDAGAGDVAGPFRTTIPTTRGAQEFWVVVNVADVRGAGEFTFEDYRDQIRQQIERSKRLQRLITGLREAAYIDIRI